VWSICFDLIKAQNIYVNSQYAKLTGYTLKATSKLSVKDFYNLFHTDKILSSPNQTNIIKALEVNEILELEYQFKNQTIVGCDAVPKSPYLTLTQTEQPLNIWASFQI
jgi:hypothetical protein